MVKTCCVPNCSEVYGFQFPKCTKLRKKWQVAIRRSNAKKQLWKPAYHSIVCAKHFKKSDFKEKNSAGFDLIKRKLKKGAVPSIFFFDKTTSEIDPSVDERSKRFERRAAKQEVVKSPEKPISDLDFALEVEIDNTVQSDVEDKLEVDECVETIITHNVGVQVSVPAFGNLRLNQFENDLKAIKYYTSFKDINHFRFFFDCLGPAAFKLNFHCLSLDREDELFLCLMKLRQNKGLFKLF